MNELISLLEKKVGVIKNLTQDNAGWRDGTISADGLSVVVGCSTVSFDKVREVFNAMQEVQK